MFNAQTWVNGQNQHDILVTDRGLCYGDGVFETMRVSCKHIPLFTYHKQRLFHSLDKLAIAHNTAEIETEIDQFLACIQADNPDQAQFIIKLIITRGSGGRGYFPSKDCKANRILSAFPLTKHPGTFYKEGVHTFNCKNRLSQSKSLQGIKHLCRLDQVLARGEWTTNQYAEGLMKDQEGYLAEGTFSNLFYVTNNTLTTHPLDNEGVRGVMRQWIIDKAKQLKINYNENRLNCLELSNVDEIFLCNSVFGIWPVRSYDQYFWPVGKITRKLQHEVAKLF